MGTDLNPDVELLRNQMERDRAERDNRLRDQVAMRVMRSCLDQREREGREFGYEAIPALMQRAFDYADAFMLERERRNAK